MARATIDESQIVNGQNSTTETNGHASIPFNVADFRHIVLYLSAGATGTLTFTVNGSNHELLYSAANGGNGGVNFQDAPSSTNRYSKLAVRDLDTGLNIPGGTGVVVTGVENYYEVNTNGLTWIEVRVGGFNAFGSVWIKPFNDKQ